LVNPHEWKLSRRALLFKLYSTLLGYGYMRTCFREKHENKC
jgi:hypothetical protein